jgi:serine/threonine-protein kinase RsbW
VAHRTHYVTEGLSVSNSTVRLEIPAASGYLALARTAVVAMCARLHYPIDVLEDVKLAVDEACSLLLSDTEPDNTLIIALSPGDDSRLDIEVTARTRQGRAPRQTSFAWTVMSALVDEVSATAVDGDVTISLRASLPEIAVSK